VEFRLPDIGEGVAEGEIVKWHVAAGDSVTEDQPLVEVMTDKATVMIPCPVAGKIEKIIAKDGQVVAVGAPIVIFGSVTSGRVASHGHGHAAAEKHAGSSDEARTAAPVGTATALAEEPADRVLATPATRRRARELEVDIRRVKPTGPGGRVTREDVERASAGTATPAPADLAKRETIKLDTKKAAPPVTAKSPTAKIDYEALTTAAPAKAAPKARPAPTPLPPAPAGQLEERVPLRGIRRKIAEHLVKSKFTAPHFTYFEEVDVTDLVELREKAKPIAEARGVKLTYLPFIMKTVCAALREHPALNASLDDATGEIVYKKYYNLGFAADTDAGLVVPVIKQADRRSILDIARELDRLSQAARAGMLELEDIQGGTFTISSVGSLGGLMATPIINHPEVGIMGVHKIARRPVVRGDKIEIGSIMYLSLSLDHRVVDGATAARFMNTVVKYLEDPKLLLLEGI
jgi:pyruvate dehydrogenase E2 component (dihydrolipoamide acetyltransferase)